MPFTSIEFAGHVIEVDVERTRAAYAIAGQSGCEECGCGQCRKFLALRPDVYPEAFLEILESLGIAFDKEVDVFALGPYEDGKWLIDGWFHFFGDEATVPAKFRFYEEANGFEAWVHVAPRSKLPALAGASCVIEFRFWLPD